MALTKMTKDMAIIQALDDEPNDVGGLSAQELKEKFDEAGETIKKYLNETLTSELDTALAGTVPTTRTVNRHPLSADVIVTKSDVGLGNVENTSDADKPVSTQQKAALMLKANKTDVLEKENTTPFTPSADYHPATKKYVDDTTSDIAIGILPDKSVTSEKLANGSVTAEKMANQFYANVTHTHLPSDLITAVPISKGGTGKTTAAEALAALGGYTKAEVDGKISAVQPAVGDIKTTVRTDLGNNWLLCNGEAVSEADYPELTAVLPVNPINGKWAEIESPFSGYTIYFLTYENGYWIVGAYRASDRKGFVFYKSDLSAVWSQSSEIDQFYPTDIKYYADKWVICGSSGGNGAIAYASSLAGPYTIKSNIGIELKSLNIAGGNLVACGSGQNYSVISPAVYWTTDPAGTWSSKVLFNDGTAYGEAFNVIFVNSTFCVAIKMGAGADIAFAATLDGEYSITRIGTVDGVNSVVLKEVSGLFVTVVSAGSNSAVFYSNSPAASWTESPTSFYLESNDSSRVPQIDYRDGMWVLMAGGQIDNNADRGLIVATTSDLANAFEVKIGVSLPNQGFYFSGVAYNDGLSLCILTQTEPGLYLNAPYFLPEITGEAYSYIKAK